MSCFQTKIDISYMYIYTGGTISCICTKVKYVYRDGTISCRHAKIEFSYIYIYIVYTKIGPSAVYTVYQDGAISTHHPSKRNTGSGAG